MVSITVTNSICECKKRNRPKRTVAFFIYSLSGGGCALILLPRYWLYPLYPTSNPSHPTPPGSRSTLLHPDPPAAHTANRTLPRNAAESAFAH